MLTIENFNKLSHMDISAFRIGRTVTLATQYQIVLFKRNGGHRLTICLERKPESDNTYELWYMRPGSKAERLFIPLERIKMIDDFLTTIILLIT